MESSRIIASGDARPIPPAVEPRAFLTTGESLCTQNFGDQAASLQINPAAPNASLHGLGAARCTGAYGILELVLEQSLPIHVTQALEFARDAVEELELIFEELQARDAAARKGGAQ